MRIKLEGHDCRYSIEQSLLLLFPEERPEYVEELGPEETDGVLSRASFGERFLTVTTTLRRGEIQVRRSCREVLPEDPGEVERQLRRTVKRSFFSAATALTGEVPPWGALTGIRPAKLLTQWLDAGMEEKEVLRELKDKYAVREDKALLCLQAARESRSAREKLRPEEISLYVGIPFCPSRCIYCSFVSHSIEGAKKLITPYLEALGKEIRAAGEAVRRAGLKVHTVYFGGGTPTILSPQELGGLLNRLETAFDLSQVAEFTVEGGRPDTITEEKLKVLRAHGVQRISVNPQTMDDRVLEAIGRSHTARLVEEAVALVRRAGFEALNMDLIAGLPLDTPGGFRRSLSRLLELRPENITVHTLALKRGAALRFQNLRLPNGAEVGEMISLSRHKLEEAGYGPYYLYRQKFMSGSFENVGWSLEDRECLYNIYMMEELHTVLSLGAGGVTKLVDAGARKLRRICNPKYPYEYMSALPRILEEKGELVKFYTERREAHGL